MSAAEGLAVGLSLWVGGAGLAACKLAAYVATGSPLVRASMFDSLGDVFSSVIMQITQRKIADTRDARRYPLGKHRFESLGVLFFCAFMTATMTNMIIDSLQTLLSPPEDAGPGAGDALRRLLEENPRLRWGYLPWSRPSVDALVAQYGGGEEEESEQSLATVLMVACVLVKLLCFAYCKAVAQRTQSGVVAALADDHRNDAVSNLFAAITMIVIRVLEDKGVSGEYLAKLDPLVALLLSTWIVYNWVSTAVEHLQKLSDEVVDDEELQRIQSAAEDALRGSSLQVDAAHVYSVGDGCQVSLELAPVKGNAASEQVASALAKLGGAIRGASESVQEVGWRLRPEPSHEWVAGYAKP
mmetsp:Transcript_70833/g.201015  ORF Transcript_70833/g.201015 Transcript_70833/m.201015 type:complete len:356 (-) Transcript_70833:92-1159(-)